MKSYDTPGHTTGSSIFVDDLPAPADLLHAGAVTSKAPAGEIVAIDTEDALGVPGAHRVFLAGDIPGKNALGPVFKDETILAKDRFFHCGQPIAVTVADTPEGAREMARRVRVEEREHEAQFDCRAAAAAGSFVAPTMAISAGDVGAAWKDCNTIVEGTASSGAQEHLYLETHSSMAIPLERGGVKIYCATQSPSAVQREVAKALNLSMNAVEVETARLGGAFGGKEDQATHWAIHCALSATKLKRPVKLVLERTEDLRFTGKRHPYEFDYKLGLGSDGKLLCYEAVFYQNSGAFADLSTAIMERSLFHATGAYHIPNVKITGHLCKTNLPAFTAFRGFGGPQAIFCIEAAIDHCAIASGIPRRKLQQLNLVESGDHMPFGADMESSLASRSFDEAVTRYELDRIEKEASRFNAENRFQKRGVSIMPICFGISFTNRFLNQAGALVHIYTDGSVRIATGAVEMGQGVNTKLITIAAKTLGISRKLVSLSHTDTTKVANISPTAASTAADLNGMAVKLACDEIKGRLTRLAAESHKADTNEIVFENGCLLAEGERHLCTFREIVARAYTERVNLSAQTHYATPGLTYDKETAKGRPFAYHVFGAAVTSVTLDVLRGELFVDGVRIVHDAGKSLDETIDMGQVEGALVQGLGWITMEEVVYKEGRLLTDTLSTYKIPDMAFAPNIDVRFLEDVDNPNAVMRSKAVGEPPFLYSIGAFTAALDALRAATAGSPIPYEIPLTNERIFNICMGGGDN